MPIEFNCRSCNAFIRVPDSAAGGKGRCPKCSLRLTVPRKSTAKPAAPAPPPPSAKTERPLPFAAPEPDDVAEEVVLLETADFHAEDLAAPLPGVSPENPFAATNRAARKPARRGSRRGPLLMGVITVACVAAGFGAYLLRSGVVPSKLTGQALAGNAAQLELPPVLIEKADIDFPKEDLDVLLKKLELAPVPLSSTTMMVNLIGAADGLKISVASGSASEFYRVNTRDNEPIQKYLEQHRTDFESRRRRDVRSAASAFFKQYQEVIAKQATSNSVIPFRDSLALPALVGPLGFVVVAEYQRGLYRCVYEDANGGLYFLLPPGAKEFRVLGRTDASNRPLAAVELQIRVEGEIVPPKIRDVPPDKKPVDSPSANDEKPEQGEQMASPQ